LVVRLEWVKMELFLIFQLRPVAATKYNFLYVHSSGHDKLRSRLLVFIRWPFSISGVIWFVLPYLLDSFLKLY
jgi:hypothetical protein